MANVPVELRNFFGDRNKKDQIGSLIGGPAPKLMNLWVVSAFEAAPLNCARLGFHGECAAVGLREVVHRLGDSLLTARPQPLPGRTSDPLTRIPKNPIEPHRLPTSPNQGSIHIPTRPKVRWHNGPPQKCSQTWDAAPPDMPSPPGRRRRAPSISQGSGHSEDPMHVELFGRRAPQRLLLE